MKYIHYIAHHAMLPNIASIIDRSAVAYFLDSYDTTLRLDLQDYDLYADTGSIVTFVLRLETIMTTLDTVTMQSIRHYLLNFLPYRAGIPQPAMLGVSPLHAVSWWNTSFYITDVIFSDTESQPVNVARAVGSNTSGTDPAGTHPGLYAHGGDPVQWDCYDPQISIAHAMLTASWDAFTAVAGPTWSVSLQTYNLDTGVYIPLDTGVQEPVLPDYAWDGAGFTAANDLDSYQYENSFYFRFKWIVAYGAGQANAMRGNRHHQMTPTIAFHSEFYELMYLAGLMMNGIRWINHLSAIASGSFPRGIHYSIEAAFSQGA